MTALLILGLVIVALGILVQKLDYNFNFSKSVTINGKKSETHIRKSGRATLQGAILIAIGIAIIVFAALNS